MSRRAPSRAIAGAAIAAILSMALAAVAQAAAPVKLVPSVHLGWEVNKTTKGAVCTVASGDECQPASVSAKPGGFEYVYGAVVAPDGKVYVADNGNRRVQELSATGAFVLMFGRKVNRTKTAELEEPGNPHGVREAEENVCTAVSGDVCGAGEQGESTEAFGSVLGLAVEPGSEDVYVADYTDERVDKYTAQGEFVWMAGEEVNATKTAELKEVGNPHDVTKSEENLCTLASGDTCQNGKPRPTQSSEACAFRFNSNGVELSFGGPSDDVLYVPDGQRIQTLGVGGECTGEIKLPPAVIATAPGGQVGALAASAGTIYIAYSEETGTVHELSTATGDQVNELTVVPQPGEEEVKIQFDGIALDPAGHLAVGVNEEGKGLSSEAGYLYEATGGQLLTEFTVPSSSQMKAIQFGGNGELYTVQHSQTGGPELLVYTPEPVAELHNVSGACVDGPNRETDATLNCSLAGEVNPWGVAETQAWFEWGRSELLGEVTPAEAVCAASCGSSGVRVAHLVEGVKPGEGSFYYRVRAYDHNVTAPEEPLNSATIASLPTPTVPPRVIGEPAALYVTPSAAALFGQVNPENANTTYEFQYATAGACEERAAELEVPSVPVSECPGMNETTSLESNAYGAVGVSGEAANLLSSTTYRYRLFAVNAKGEEALDATGQPGIAEASFTTAPAPSVAAQTGAASQVGVTTAQLSGAVETDGQAATYTFELGVYEGAATRYGLVYSGPVAATSEAVPEQVQLSDLQPGTTYAYRIGVHVGDGSGPGASALGAAETFATQGLPDVLVSPAAAPLLATPDIAFPTITQPTHVAACKRGYKRNARGKCVRSAHAKRKRSRARAKRKGAARKRR